MKMLLKFTYLTQANNGYTATVKNTSCINKAKHECRKHKKQLKAPTPPPPPKKKVVGKPQTQARKMYQQLQDSGAILECKGSIRHVQKGYPTLLTW